MFDFLAENASLSGAILSIDGRRSKAGLGILLGGQAMRPDGANESIKMA